MFKKLIIGLLTFSAGAAAGYAVGTIVTRRKDENEFNAYAESVRREYVRSFDNERSESVEILSEFVKKEEHKESYKSAEEPKHEEEKCCYDKNTPEGDSVVSISYSEYLYDEECEKDTYKLYDDDIVVQESTARVFDTDELKREIGEDLFWSLDDADDCFWVRLKERKVDIEIVKQHVKYNT